MYKCTTQVLFSQEYKSNLPLLEEAKPLIQDYKDFKQPHYSYSSSFHHLRTIHCSIDMDSIGIFQSLAINLSSRPPICRVHRIPIQELVILFFGLAILVFGAQW